MATYENGPLRSLPAVTRHSFHGGSAYYLGTKPDANFLSRFILEICRRAGIASIAETPPEVEVTRRSHDDKSFLFALNHSDEPATLDLPGRVLQGDVVNGSLVRLAPYGVAVLEERTD
jgi:beta-galactosidase